MDSHGLACKRSTVPLGMDWDALTLNLAYVVYVGATFFKDLFRLRVVLVVSAVAFITYGVVAGIWSVVIWNALFGLGSSIQLYRLFAQRRRVNLSVEDEVFRASYFGDLDRVDFFTLWSLGLEESFVDEPLIHEGAEGSPLMLILEGAVDVVVDGKAMNRLGEGDLIGEIGLVRHGVATADCVADGTVRVRSWSREQLSALEAICPAAATSLKLAIGLNLAGKVVSTTDLNRGDK